MNPPTLPKATLESEDVFVASLVNLVSVYLHGRRVAEIADSTGVSKSSVYKYRRGDVTYPRMQTLLSLLRYCGFTLEPMAVNRVKASAYSRMEQERVSRPVLQ